MVLTSKSYDIYFHSPFIPLYRHLFLVITFMLRSDAIFMYCLSLCRIMLLHVVSFLSSLSSISFFSFTLSLTCYLSLNQSTASSLEDDKSQLSMRSQTPQGMGEGGEGYDPDRQVVWNKAALLPTPEEKMRRAAQAVPTDIVAINVTGMSHLMTSFSPSLNC